MEDNSLEEEFENNLVNSVDESQLVEKTVADLPETLYVFPLLRRPFFPGMAAPLVIEPGVYYDLLKVVAKSKHKCVALLLTKNEDIDIYKVKPKNLYKTGVLARVLRIIPMEQGGAQVILNMEKRLTMKRTTPGKKYMKAKFEYYEDHPKLTRELKAYGISIISTIKELLKLNPLFKEELQIFLGHSDFTEPGKLADFAVALTTASREELQEVLETFDVPKRIEKALMLLKKELDLTELQVHLSKKIEAGISKTQREFFLREQLRTIKRELGIEKDEKSADFEKFDARLKERTLNPEIDKVVAEEMEKLATLDTQSSEYSVSRGYLDWLTIVPWGIYSEDNFDLEDAEQVLEKDHYGLQDIKKRILEFIGVGKLTGGVKGSIICLVGPPGVGKTSIGRSIARALGRKFYRFSVGGMHDEAEIKGHRRTYVGAMPGKLVQALKYSQTMNPVIMIDEIDKIGSGSQSGDPVSALLEVLDPEQNVEFLDHYMDVRTDLANVLFILTANILDTIPEPLIDRMEILRLSGYILQEKLEIAKKFLIPRNRKAMGLKAKNIVFTKEALKHIINGYAREAGVRTLENTIKKILRKTAMIIVKSQENGEEDVEKIRIGVDNLEEFLGKPIFTSDRFYEQTPVGVCTGLAWTALGGATLYIEALRVPHEKTEMKLTGQAGDVMKESSQIAWTYLHGALQKYAPTYTFFEKSQVHIHIPEGATPKDGPSAGVAMVTALLSLILDEPVLHDLGMTGELTLTGRILPIGGMKEKVVAARRSGLSKVIFPKDNERDFVELPEYLKEGITFHFVDHYDEVFQIAFPTIAEEEYL
ncbi:MAG: Lon protease 2 [Chlamydiae bacterium]|nr:Lon protease 2 [Chlamydiota bacterium]